MKASLLLAVAVSATAFAESAIPTAHERERYQETFASSPFALATPEAPKEEEPKDDEFANLVVTGLGKLDDGRNFVVVRRTGDESSMRFEGNEPNRDGYSVKEVKWSERWGQTSVVLSKGAKQGTVKFNENLVSAAPPVQTGGGRPPGSGGKTAAPPPIIPTGINPGNQPTAKQPGAANIPRPTGGGQVPRPGGGGPGSNFRGGANFTAPNGSQPATSPNSGAPRQRVRSINNR